MNLLKWKWEGKIEIKIQMKEAIKKEEKKKESGAKTLGLQQTGSSNIWLSWNLYDLLDYSVTVGLFFFFFFYVGER